MHGLNRIVVTALVLIMAGMLPLTAIAEPESKSSIEPIFQQAKRDYLQEKLNSSALQIKKGAAYMESQAQKASAKGKEALTASSKELEKLADDVKKGAVTSGKRMEESFARAYHALAVDAHIKSTESWTKKEAAKAGAALDSANKNLEKSFTWAGQKVEKSTQDVMKKSDEISLKLQKKGNLIAEDVANRLKDAGNEIEKFGKKISPR
ncbi:MAG: hypothetical protein CVU52_09210 [Deltaproteobacteria bacterium HGW-Deltaproteobacteria-10]|nr:MAG: hypothetical protein CVU52_09210 [Deltaproteobacteria bacterium HGW-Deltaproteobacteria-10]